MLCWYSYKVLLYSYSGLYCNHMNETHVNIFLCVSSLDSNVDIVDDIYNLISKQNLITLESRAQVSWPKCVPISKNEIIISCTLVIRMPSTIRSTELLKKCLDLFGTSLFVHLYIDLAK